MGKEVHNGSSHVFGYTALHSRRPTPQYLTVNYVAVCFTLIMLLCLLVVGKNKHGRNINLWNI